MLTIDINRINFQQELGRGQFGSVYCLDEDNQKWAIKRSMVQYKQIKVIKYVIQEIAIGFSFNHPNILPICGFDLGECEEVEDTWYVYLKMPRMEKSLKDMLSKKNKFEEEKVIKYFYWLTSGLEYLHSRNIAHRDMKPANILIDKEGIVKISDVGVAKFIENKDASMTDIAGSRLYLAPEIEKFSSEVQKLTNLKKGVFFEADMWSLGMIMIEICVQNKDIYQNYQSHHDKKAFFGDILNKLQGKYSDKLLNLISRLVQVNPSQRIPSHELKKLLRETFPQILKEYLEDEEPSKLGSKMKEEKIDTNKIIFYEKWNKLFNLQNQSAKEIKIDLKIPKQYLTKNFDLNPSGINNKAVMFISKSIGGANQQNLIFPTDWKRVDQSVIQEFLNDLNGIKEKNWESLTVNLTGILNVNKSAIDIMTQVGSNLKNLKQIHLSFANAKDLESFTLKELQYQLSNNFQHLTQLSLNFSGCRKIEKQAFIDLLAHIPRNIKDLDLNLTGCAHVNKKVLYSMSSQIESNLINLEHLSLKFDHCYKITDDSFKNLISRIGKKFQRLQKLWLHLFRCPEISGSAIINLTEVIGKNLKNLKDLSLDFSFPSHHCIDDKVCSSITTNLGGLELEHLSLEFVKSEITEKGIIELARHIGGNCHKLKSLHLNFSLCDQIGDNAIIELGTQIGKNLKAIQSLSLDFFSSTVTDKGIKELAKQLGDSLKNLKHLSLNFSDNNQITSRSIEDLGAHIGSNLKELCSLSLEFMTFKDPLKITEQAILHLASQIGPNIKNLKLNFYGCYEITDEGIKMLVTEIKSKIKALNFLSLHSNE